MRILCAINTKISVQLKILKYSYQVNIKMATIIKNYAIKYLKHGNNNKEDM